MPRYTLPVLLAFVGVGAGWTVTAGQLPPRFVTCLHETDAAPPQRARRAEALRLARAINAAQRDTVARTQRYEPLPGLSNLPAAPAGFDLRLYTDGEGYLFSLMDTRDPCHYGIFSNESGRLYEHTQPPLIAR